MCRVSFGAHGIAVDIDEACKCSVLPKLFGCFGDVSSFGLPIDQTGDNAGFSTRGGSTGFDRIREIRTHFVNGNGDSLQKCYDIKTKFYDDVSIGNERDVFINSCDKSTCGGVDKEIKSTGIECRIGGTNSCSDADFASSGGGINGHVDKLFSDRGPNYERNKLNRENKKKRKQRKRIRQGKIMHNSRIDGSAELSSGSETACDLVSNSTNSKDSVEKSLLRISLEEKWKVENELAVAKARRQLQVLEANSVDDEVRKYRSQICAATERNLVSIEKVHKELKRSGNTTDSDDSRVHTILDDGNVGCTISPDSSASQHEYRKAVKALADSEHENERYKKAFEQMGLSLEAYELKDKSEWTDTPENHKLLDQLYPDGYGMDVEYCAEGKFVIC